MSRFRCKGFPKNLPNSTTHCNLKVHPSPCHLNYHDPLVIPKAGYFLGRSAMAGVGPLTWRIIPVSKWFTITMVITNWDDPPSGPLRGFPWQKKNTTCCRKSSSLCNSARTKRTSAGSSGITVISPGLVERSGGWWLVTGNVVVFDVSKQRNLLTWQ